MTPLAKGAQGASWPSRNRTHVCEATQALLRALEWFSARWGLVTIGPGCAPPLGSPERVCGRRGGDEELQVNTVSSSTSEVGPLCAGPCAGRF